MKRIVTTILSVIIILLMVSACGTHSSDIKDQPSSNSPTESVTSQAESVPNNYTPQEAEQSESEIDESEKPTSTDTTSPSQEVPPTSVPAPSSSPESLVSDGMTDISITIDGTVFLAKLYNNNTANALLELFPLTVDMTELNGNEKFYYLTNSLPTDSKRVGSVSTGDLMLYGSDCLVLFYESFTTSYSYTKLGYIEDISGLVDILGHGNVQALFAVE